ncbi:MAG: hypothetical protein CME62_00200 [Halobacteriovoraceae bacterium]|nr:hypothetical protein [Halobacteriovoraceae bacterium]|tara:strand:- start:21675 stop:22430 length:756 start_codon:yes stop_codon:yes gene_type:complete
MSLSIFITGGTSGIGKALAEYYLEQGHRVAVCGRDETKFSFLKTQENISYYQVNVVNRDEIYNAVYDFHQKGGLDLIVASAGVGFSRKTKIPDFQRSRDIVNINLLGVINTFEPAIEIMTKQKSGHLVAISSVASLCGFPGVSAYSAAKAGVNKLCEGYAVDLREYNIDVTTIAPGFVDTPLTKTNHHPMPFLTDIDVARDKIVKAIESKKAFFVFPFFFGVMLRFLSIIPRGLYLKMMKLFKFKYAKPKD